MLKVFVRSQRVEKLRGDLAPWHELFEDVAITLCGCTLKPYYTVVEAEASPQPACRLCEVGGSPGVIAKERSGKWPARSSRSTS